MFRTYSKWSNFSDFQDTNIAVIEENAQNQTANLKKAPRVRNVSGGKERSLNAYRAASKEVRNK